MYGILLESTDGGGDAWRYLILGPEKAMLVDTTTGGMLPIVANTHPHGDHTGSNCQFGQVYILEDNVEDLKKVMATPAKLE